MNYTSNPVRWMTTLQPSKVTQVDQVRNWDTKIVKTGLAWSAYTLPLFLMMLLLLMMMTIVLKKNENGKNLKW